jgi:hypothetical protein
MFKLFLCIVEVCQKVSLQFQAFRIFLCLCLCYNSDISIHGLNKICVVLLIGTCNLYNVNIQKYIQYYEKCMCKYNFSVTVV